MTLNKDSYINSPKVQGKKTNKKWVLIRVPTSSGNHEKPGKSQKKVPCLEKSWNLKKTE